MLHILDFADASGVYQKHNITKVIIPIAVDTMADCKLYKMVSQKYTDLDQKFQQVVGGKTLKPGEYVRIQLDNGHVVFFIVIRNIEKYQPYMVDILHALDKVLAVIRREVTSDTSAMNGVLFPLPGCDELKLSDSLFIPAVAEKLNVKDLTVCLLTTCDYSQFIDSITEDAIYCKRDSWRSDWMMTLDDILMLDIIKNLQTTTHDFKISKSNLVRCYYVCHQHGMFPKLEFYDTEYGKFFKMFLPKSNSLINHGLLMNTHHYSTQEPKKFSCILGPMFPHLMNIAYTQIMSNRARTMQIATEVKQDYIKSFQNKPQDAQKPAYNKQPYQKREPDDTNMFNL